MTIGGEGPNRGRTQNTHRQTVHNVDVVYLHAAEVGEGGAAPPEESAGKQHEEELKIEYIWI